jgi:hypothetical protein
LVRSILISASQERAIGKDSSSNRSIRGSGQPEWDRQSERSGGLQVDDQLELGWLLDRQIRGVFIGCRRDGSFSLGFSAGVELRHGVAQQG